MPFRTTSLAGYHYPKLNSENGLWPVSLLAHQEQSFVPSASLAGYHYPKLNSENGLWPVSLLAHQEQSFVPSVLV